MNTSGEHSIVCVSNPSLSEINVTWYSSEVDVRVVAALGAIGANPWTETARARERRVLANMLIDYFGECMFELLFTLWFMFSSDQLELEVEVVSSDFLVQPPRDSSLEVPEAKEGMAERREVGGTIC